MKYFIVDAFTSEPFGGNPAGVVLLDRDGDFPEDTFCVKVARELRYSETAFVKRLDAHTFHLRYFTPESEVDLCGHATIGAFAALRRSGGIGDGDFRLRTRSGELRVSVCGGRVNMDMATPKALAEITDETALTELYRIMGLNWAEQCAHALTLPPQLVSTGLPDIMLPVWSRGELARIEPNFPALAALSKRYGVVGVHAFTRDGGGATCHVRNFAPLYGINEESATGTANGALTYYGCLHGFIAAGDDCRFIQGEKLGRPSVVSTHIEKDGSGYAIRIGGEAVIVAEGELLAVPRLYTPR
ncbi:MAG: PhzF family phenazine biosynthesis protein [Ruminococcaceae bacterium]|nr:PhzF family phenazine biosynthesis protein [Oscillospiraceae bacterium]